MTMEITDAMVEAMIKRTNIWHKFSRGFIRAAIADVLAAAPDPWRDISTAPHDGSWHLIRHPHYSIPIVARRIGPGSEQFESFGEIFESGENPTHWTPLPPPPKLERP